MNRENKIQHSQIPVWAPKIHQAKLKRLYISDALGIIDEELLNEVGWALWSRCDSILVVTKSHYGRVVCPSCGTAIEHPDASLPPTRVDEIKEHITPWNEDDMLICGNCNWHVTWKAYHQTYRGKQLFGGNAVAYFAAYHIAYPQATTPKDKMLLIDQLIHSFHTGLTELGRPVGANLINGSLKEVIFFLDGLTNGPESATGLGNSQQVWRRNLESISWAQQFISSSQERDVDSPDTSP